MKLHGTIVGGAPPRGDEHDGDDDEDDGEPSRRRQRRATEDQRESARVFRIALEARTRRCAAAALRAVKGRRR